MCHTDLDSAADDRVGVDACGSSVQLPHLIVSYRAAADDVHGAEALIHDAEDPGAVRLEPIARVLVHDRHPG